MTGKQRHEVSHCKRCGTRTGQYRLGFVPLGMFEQATQREWVNANICLSCESLVPKRITPEEMNQAEERYISSLVQLDIISEEDAEDILSEQ